MEDRNETHPNKRAFVLTLSAAALATIFCAIDLLRIPADSKNAFLFGLSKERLLLAGGFFVLFLLNLCCLIFRDKTEHILISSEKGFVFSLTSAVVSLFFLLMPDYRFRKAAAYFTRLRPYLLWIFLTSVIFLIYFTYTQQKFFWILDTQRNLIAQKKFILPVLAVLLFGVVFVEITDLGKTAESSLWNKNGIPLQSIQLFLSLVIFFLFWKSGIFSRIENKCLLNFLIIWAVSALIWSLAPMEDHFFAPGPYQPNGQFYPYSDAFNYDFSSQTALHGWGYNMRRTLLKPTLAFITFLCHLATGNDINHSMMLQSAAFGILPAIVYLFGSAIGGCGCGYLAAAFSVVKEWNALRTRTVMTINSRLFMSEFLTQILLAVFCYVLFLWLKKDKKESLYAIIAGGTLTLGFFTRYNFAAFLPAAILLVLIAYRKHFLRFLKTLLFFFLTITLTAAPLLYRDKDVSWGLLPELKYTVNTILLKNRLSNPTPEAAQESVSADPVREEIMVSSAEPPAEEISIPEKARPTDQIIKEPEPSEKPVSGSSAAEKKDTAPDVSPVKSTPEETGSDIDFSKAAALPTASVSEVSTDFLQSASEEFNTEQITQELQNVNSTVTLPVYQSIINHGLHNFIASALTLPMEPYFHDLENLYTQQPDGLWSDSWHGEFNTKQWIMIAVWIILGSISIGMILKDHGPAGFSLPYFWLVYSFSVGVSRSSGGRYVVPTNWIPMLLLAYCITLFLSGGKITLPEIKPNKAPVWQSIVALSGFFAFFFAMYFLENHMPISDVSVPEGDLAVLKQRLSDHQEIDWDLVSSQQQEGLLHVTHGIAIYPRFYYFNDGENINNDLLMWKNYSRMTFSGINLEAGGINLVSQGYLMPHTSMIGNFPQDAVFRAISCKSDFGYEDVLAVTIETKEGDVFTYVRDPLPDFSCPVPEPVCYTLENCY